MKSDAMSDILSGTAGGVAQVVVGHPLDTLKTVLSVQTQRQSMRSLAKQLWYQGGVKEFYRGAASPLAGAMLHNSVLFFARGTAERWWRVRRPGRELQNGFLAGGSVGVAACVAETPVDLLKVKLQVGGQYEGVFSAAKQIIGVHGPMVLWQGAGATLIRNVPCFALYFGFANAVKHQYTRRGQSIGVAGAFLSGSAAGFGFWGILYPLDVIKNRMQAQPTVRSKRKYRSWLHCVSTTYKEEGMAAFFKGYTPCVLRALVANGGIFLAFEGAKHFLSKE